MRKNVLILYGEYAAHIGAVSDYLLSFREYSRHNIYYLPATQYQPCKVDLIYFDAVIVHYSVRMCVKTKRCPNILSKTFFNKLAHYSGFKALFIQDEYDTTNIAKEQIKKLGFNTIFTCIPESYIEKIYPPSEFPSVKFINVLTGYVSDNLLHQIGKPIAERKTYIAYRGRELPFWYGNLGQEKANIGKKMKIFCEEYAITPVDIEWEENKRIYGANWSDFLRGAKATLATESGANIFDFDGTIRQQIEAELEKNPALTFEMIFDKYLAQHEDFIKMNQISPKVFEAISLKTALILFEGEYSGVIKPYKHFIPLKKDFSNIEEVMSYLRDNMYLQFMVDRAYQDIILSEKYSYKSFIHKVDDVLSTVISKNTTYFYPVALNNDKKFVSWPRGIKHFNLPSNTIFGLDEEKIRLTPCLKEKQVTVFVEFIHNLIEKVYVKSLAYVRAMPLLKRFLKKIYPKFMFIKRSVHDC